jgi:hypothetical protein
MDNVQNCDSYVKECARLMNTNRSLLDEEAASKWIQNSCEFAGALVREQLPHSSYKGERRPRF